jgi:hypothetical protein
MDTRRFRPSGRLGRLTVTLLAAALGAGMGTAIVLRTQAGSRDLAATDVSALPSTTTSRSSAATPPGQRPPVADVYPDDRAPGSPGSPANPTTPPVAVAAASDATVDPPAPAGDREPPPPEASKSASSTPEAPTAERATTSTTTLPPSVPNTTLSTPGAAGRVPRSSPAGERFTIDGVTSADGGATLANVVTIHYTIGELPADGDRLFLICNLVTSGTTRPTYFGKATLTEAGAHEVTVAFGGKAPVSPTIVGTTRECSIVRADPAAAELLSFLMAMDEQHKPRSPTDNHLLDDDRHTLPEGATIVSNTVPITVERVATA